VVGWRYAPLYGPHTGRSRRVIAPDRWHPVSGRVGGPAPQPGPNPAAGPGRAAPTPTVTPSPRPGPSPVAPPAPGLPSLPGLPSFSNPFDALGSLADKAAGNALAAGQIALGVLVVGVGLALIAQSPTLPARVARGAGRAVLGAVR
jgi:hypothetical protein